MAAAFRPVCGLGGHHTGATTAAAEFCARGPDDFDWSTPNANNEPPLPFAGSDEEDLLGWALALFAITREWQDGVHDDDVAFQAARGPRENRRRRGFRTF